MTSKRKGGLQMAATTWYTKEKPTFSDAIAAVRRLLWNSVNISTSDNEEEMIKIPKYLLDHFQQVLAHAA
jgi:hypothetical protein